MLQTGKCYEAVVDTAVETANALLDLEGGRLMAAIAAETIQELLNAGNADGAMIVLRKLFEVADVTAPEWAEMDEGQSSRWLELWADALTDALECTTT